MYYVYILKSPISGLPFYVGVGKENRRSNVKREHSHIIEAKKFKEGKVNKGANKHKLNTILSILDQGYDVAIEIISSPSFNDEKCAFAKEIELIAHYGRRDMGTGILTNMTDGGEGRVNPSLEQRLHQSKITKGKVSPLKGKKVGPYSEERKLSQKEKMKITRSLLTDEERLKRHENRSNACSGKVPWNKGKTASTDVRVAIYTDARKGKKRPNNEKFVPWCKGKTKETDSRLANISKSNKGKLSPFKGKPSGKKGMTYEEIYGFEVSEKMKETRRNTAWVTNGLLTKKIKIDEIQTYLDNGWIRGRTMKP